jgi:hypothetical protein
MKPMPAKPSVRTLRTFDLAEGAESEQHRNRKGKCDTKRHAVS